MNIINTEFFKRIRDSKKITFLVIFFIIGIILMILPTGDKPPDYEQPDDSLVREDVYDTEDYSKNLERELETLLSFADGVGEVRVLIKYKPLLEKTKFSDDNLSLENMQSQDVFNSIEGVIIVAQGGGSQKIKFELTEAVSELLGIPAHKVNILKMNSGGN